MPAEERFFKTLKLLKEKRTAPVTELTGLLQTSKSTNIKEAGV